MSERTSNDSPQGSLCGQRDHVGCRYAERGSSVKSEMCEELEKGNMVGAEMNVSNRDIMRSWMQMRWEGTPAMDKRHGILFFANIVSGSEFSLEW